MAATSPEPGTGMFARKPTDRLLKGAEEGEQGLKRAVGTLDLTALGIGAIIGAGIFAIIGEAITPAGPSVIISFIIAGVTCMFSALAFAELASTIPISGSAYTYAYATLGELMAWIIGWDLVVEYSLSVAAVSVAWGGYLNELLSSLFSFDLPASIANPPGEEGGRFNLPAAFLVLAVSAVLIIGVRESARTNTIMVVVKIAVLLLFIGLGITAFTSDNFTPFATNGFNGIVDAAALIFFAYIGFDAISTSGEEAKDPGRDLPIAIVGSLALCTLMYIAVAVVATGALPADELAGQDAPLATALSDGADIGWGADLISFGALVAITSVVLTLLYGQTRILFAMARDGLVPGILAKLSARQTPIFTIALIGAIIAVFATFVPLKEIVELVNIGTLFAFIVVNIGVVILRRTQPDLERGFRVPFVPVFPIIGSLLCVYLISRLPIGTFIRFAAWMALGLLIYAFYGYRHSRLRQGDVVNPDAELG